MVFHLRVRAVASFSEGFCAGESLIGFLVDDVHLFNRALVVVWVVVDRLRSVDELTALLGNLEDMKERLFELEPPQGGEKRKSPFWDMMARESQVSAQEAYNYSGIYISYSLSSAADALKVEPYLITASENNEYVRVVHMSAYNTPHSGVGLFNNHTSSYILFNERESPELALFTIYLQLPMYDFPKMLKGLYLCLDYNRNPIARRILFVKHSDSTDMDDFLALKGEIIPKEQIPDDLLPYYNYTCQPGDFIKTCTVPSPSLDTQDLEREKKMLEL